MIYDYVIIGGGIAGLCCAYFLKEKKRKNILLLEKNPDLTNTSTAAAGLLSPIKFHTYPPALQKLCIEAIKFYPSFLQKLDAQNLIQSKGELILSDNEEELRNIQTAFKIFNLQAKLLHKNELMKNFKYLSNNIRYGLLTDEVYSVNNNLLLEKLLHSIYNEVNVNFGNEVNSIIIKNGKIVSLETRAGYIKGKNFIFATGAESLHLYKGIFNIQLKGIKGILLELTGHHEATMPVIYNHYYIVPRNNFILLAGTVVKENDQSPHIYLEYIEEIVSNIKYFYPGIVKLQLQNIRGGLRPFIKGRTILYGPSPIVKNAYIINGLFRNGVLLGPFIAHLLVTEYF